MSWITVLTLVLCLAMLALRYVLSPRVPTQPSSKQQWVKTARILGSAALALATIGYTLQRHAFDLDGKGGYEPSLIERIVMALSR